ncbi:MAG: N-acetylmuramoyl-L-alanine amidase [Clostridia bacterium]|nr:N-acetylmuramoyl-L-alanine amidase [Clostridia bacterium]
MKENKPFLYTIRFVAVAFFSVMIVLALGFVFNKFVIPTDSDNTVSAFNDNSVRFVIDAGHGGEDAGAVADDGTLEKDLNLKIAKMLYAILRLNGNEVILTRNGDTLLYDYYDDLDDYTGKKKVYDLKNRLRIAEEKDNSIYVGIHMNKFSVSKYSGLQVYYSKNNDTSYELASSLKNAVKANLQPLNNREVKRGDSSIYILNEASIPAVLIECGFLSNPQELSNLKNDEYSRALATCIFSALSQYAK